MRSLSYAHFRDSDVEPTVYSITTSETSNQMRHWRKDHWDHYWAYRLAELENLNTSPTDIEGIKEKELMELKGKKQVDIVSFIGVSLDPSPRQPCVRRLPRIVFAHGFLFTGLQPVPRGKSPGPASRSPYCPQHRVQLRHEPRVPRVPEGAQYSGSGDLGLDHQEQHHGHIRCRTEGDQEDLEGTFASQQIASPLTVTLPWPAGEYFKV